MSAADFLEFAISFSSIVLIIAFLLTVIRVIIGPTLPDRVLALDMLVAIAIGFIAVVGVKTGFALYVDIAIALGLVGFLATVAFARMILHVGKFEEADSNENQSAKSAAAVDLQKQHEVE